MMITATSKTMTIYTFAFHVQIWVLANAKVMHDEGDIWLKHLRPVLWTLMVANYDQFPVLQATESK